MIFNSFQFLALFLPIAYLGFCLAGRMGGRDTLAIYLTAVSFIFYAQFSLTLAAILGGSIAFNYAAVLLIRRAREAGPGEALEGRGGRLLLLAVTANLLALGYFKYTNFFIDVVNDFSPLGLDHLDIILPVGISFYTFIQIGFLIDVHGGRVKERPSMARYALFASFFPAVTAGPLAMSREMLDQMERWRAFDPRRLAAGLAVFAIGLFKKVVLADAIAPFADTVFDGVAAGSLVAATTAWAGSLAYTLQLYFDFSGYSDMAIGLGLVFGLRLPLNFNSPFKATSISEFWRRWHMTMTRFFTTYLYTPMAMRGMRRAMGKKAVPFERFLLTAGGPVVFTFLAAGIWHGAGWTFVVYGLVHGIALAVNHAWREFKMPDVPPAAGWALTMAVVVSGLVVFRAPDLATTGALWWKMWTFGLLDPAVATAGAAIVELDLVRAASFIAVFSMIVLMFPNTQQIMNGDVITTDSLKAPALPSGLSWRPNLAWALSTACLIAAGVGLLSNGSGFLYYQF